ncbi:efflux RND transporter periplasmic adaptor subunit [Vibrio sp. ER1A]|uniref:efflux RND transporter periplasmic adaptor subunit n=1 Tax=Vibrio sp. ER1A TaxID=1517681 RepID=UPI0004DD37C8|nr:efflux RND transporter periplasmic adaptor subunit [Vibrio sp. ER1A]KFA98704.1 hypothetical protein HW45_06645 [Vibrio sp. ER1A]
MSDKFYSRVSNTFLGIALVFVMFLIITDNVLPFSTNATVKSESLEIVPRVSGRIDSVLVESGDEVKVGTPLISIDNTDYSLALDKTRSLLKKAKSDLQEARKTHTRNRKLLKKGLVSQQNYEITENAYTVSQLALEQANIDYARAKLDFDRTNIKSNANGIVANLSIIRGTYASSGNTIGHIITSRKWIEAAFPEKSIDTFSKGTLVWVVLDAKPGQVFTGHVNYIEPASQSGINSPQNLSAVKSDTRWIRAQHKNVIRINLEVELEIPSGGMATVMLQGRGLNRTISYSWMKGISLFRYLY